MVDKLIRFSVLAILLGRGYQHLFWDGPYRSLFWDESFLLPIFGLFNISWKNYVLNPSVDLAIEIFTRVIGVFFIVSAISATKFFQSSVSTFLLRCSSLLLLFMSYLTYKESHYQFPMLIEHALQVGLPLLLSFKLWNPKWSPKEILTLKVLISLTFLGHGTYALGLGVPIPGNFVDMVLEIIPINESGAIRLLRLAGLWDYLIAILIFTPFGRANVLLFASFWGVATAFARGLTYVSISSFLTDFHSWGYEVAFRLCHGLAPLALAIILGKLALPKILKEKSEVKVHV